MPKAPPQTPTKVKKRTFPLTPSPTPTKPHLVKRQRRSAPALTVDTPRIFIGRPCCPPFVHRSDIITRINITWLKTGEIDELEYDDEISATREWHAVGLPEADVPIDLTHLDEDEESTNMSEARPVRGERADRGPRCVADETWSFAQHNAIWLAQLRHGEGKAWKKVVKLVNEVEPSQPRSMKECQAYWEISRASLVT